VQNRIAFLPSVFGKSSKNATISFAGLKPSTGVPTISMSKPVTAKGSEEVMPKTGAFVDSAKASAIRLVFPILEKYNTKGLMVSKYDFSINIIFVGVT
jgi:hypothetical protein